MQIRGEKGFLKKTQKRQKIEKRKTVKALKWVTPDVLGNVLHIDTPEMQ